MVNERMVQMEADFTTWQQKLVKQQEDEIQRQTTELHEHTAQLNKQILTLTDKLAERETEVNRLVGRLTNELQTDRFLADYLTELNQRKQAAMEVQMAKKQNEWEREKAGLLEVMADLVHQRMDPLQTQLEELEQENEYLRKVS
ncbi:hypothetical protein BDF19DRAFT_438808 [Syncephalis fuscata]|nr:hypothetical protein BDF19DRAFT_438808 [Syncephalis fuscata]